MHPLDNVIWEALNTRQTQFAEAHDQARRFLPEISTLTALLEPSPRGYTSLAGLLSPGSVAVLSLDAPCHPLPGWNLITTFPGLQMVCENGTPAPTGNTIPADLTVTELTNQDSSDMIELTTLTKPGPFGPRTHELGLYLGIRHEGKLIAMAGERLKVPGCTEVSAVCTHPDHVGKGYARILMLEVMQAIRERGEIPFLHVRQSNARALQLYERLGFRTRKVVQFTVLKKE
jgi:hypothetical protein